MSRVRAVILDVDGTLVASNDAHAHAFVDAARELGHPAEFEPIRWMIGMGSDKLIPRAFGFQKESEQGRRLGERKGEIFRERYLPGLQPQPGARALVERMREQDLTRVVATSAKKEDLQGLLERAGVQDLVEDATSASEVEDSKPDPDVVEQALADTDEPAARVVMLGDTPYDVEAARRAGVRIVAVRCGGWGDDDLQGAATVYDDPADLLEHWEDSPFAPDG